MTPNKLEPARLNTGITFVGKGAHLPDNLKVGRNCKIGVDLRPEDFASSTLTSGETVEAAVLPMVGSENSPAQAPSYPHTPAWQRAA